MIGWVLYMNGPELGPKGHTTPVRALRGCLPSIHYGT